MELPTKGTYQANLAQMMREKTKPEARPVKAVAQRKEIIMANRIVRVVIFDPSKDLPENKRVLHMGDDMLTDKTDNELFFDVGVTELLGAHNDHRKTVVNKKASEKFGRDIFLEPIRLSELTMGILVLATFPG